MKKIVLGTFLVIFTWGVFAQEKKVDPNAILILDKMSDVIGELESVSFHLSSLTDTYDLNQTLEKRHAYSTVYLVGPDKMMINSMGDKGHRQFFCNGTELWYYSYDENNYGVIDASFDILQTIDNVNREYGIEFPAADFFYPTFTDDLIESTSELDYLGKAVVNDQECFHIQAKGDELGIQIWISNDGLYLPVKYSVEYHNKKENPVFEATFTDWEINPTLPLAIFEFTPPAGANLIRFIAKSEQ